MNPPPPMPKIANHENSITKIIINGIHDAHSFGVHEIDPLNSTLRKQKEVHMYILNPPISSI